LQAVFKENEMQADQIVKFNNAELGIASFVTKTANGFAVTLWDTDAEQSVGGVRTYGSAMLTVAIDHAKALANI
jgi:hypothetical protein